MGAGRTMLLAALAAAGALMVPAGAGAASLGAADAVARECGDRLQPIGASGADRESWTAPTAGLLTAELAGGPRGDWDLALFRAGEAIAASTAFGSIEQATQWVRAGDRVVAQGCRLAGSRDSVPLSFDFLPRASLPELPAERTSLESVPVSGPEDVARLEALGLDVTHDVSATAATVALHSDDERARLAGAGFSSQTLIPDLAAADRAERAREERVALRGAGGDLPSGRTAYRVYEDYTSEMKALADANPEFVREVTIGTTLEGRPIQGLEIAADVDATDDGRPVYLNMGLHHAREWPSGELPMEFAIDLVDGYNADDPRIVSLLENVRTFIFPVINVDGFIASRSHGTSPLDDDPNATLPQIVNDQGAYKRKNCRPTVPGSELVPCNMRSNSGVDLNRNYGAYWGGSGSSSDVTAQSYRGPAPYSEPESEAVHQFTSELHPTVFITNHTFTEDGKWLRQPGFDDVILVTPDEEAMKDLGDDMADATGWTSELGYETLGDITGATEDWNYFAQGTYGYTPEIRGLNFHANYPDSVVEEYVGDAEHAGLGAREAFLIAGERAGDADEHSVITGSAPAAATLRLHKDFTTPTSQEGLVIFDELDTQLDVPDDGGYEWHVNPSSRPLVPGEVWEMSCKLPGEEPVTTTVAIDRGQVEDVDWGAACQADPPEPTVTCGGEPATILGSIADDSGAQALEGTSGDDVIVSFGGRDEISGEGGADTICAGRGADVATGGPGQDDVRGGRGRDVLRGGGAADVVDGGPGRDECADRHDQRIDCERAAR